MVPQAYGQHLSRLVDGDELDDLGLGAVLVESSAEGKRMTALPDLD